MDLIMLTLRSVAYAITEPTLVFVLILLGVMFFLKNRKLVVMQKMIIGERINSPIELTLSQIVLGIVAGVIGSLILSHIGIVFSENSGVQLIFMISIFLMFVKPRFVCFSYSGAIVGLVSIILSVLNVDEAYRIISVDILMLMTMVGILHIVEGLLVMVDGSRGAMPVFTNKNGNILGGFALNRQWIIPIAIFIAFTNVDMSTVMGDVIPTPQWWPLISSATTVSLISTALLTLIPFFGVLSYSTVTFTNRKKSKALQSGVFIMAYGIILCIISQVANFGVLGQLIVVIYAPLSHEFMLYAQRKYEERKEPLFISDGEGLAVLEVVPYSQAYNVGIRSGDKILSVNNIKVNTEGEINTIIKENFNNAVFNMRKSNGEIIDLLLKVEGNKKLGFLLVPRFVPRENVIKYDKDEFNSILEELKKENKH